MDVILTDKNRRDIAILNRYCNIYFDCNKEKKFYVQVARCNYIPEMTFGSFIYVKDEEYGGIIRQVTTSTALDYVEFCGPTVRGMLETKIVEPEDGAEHLVVSGDVYDILRNIIDGEYDGYIKVKDTLLGITLENYKFPRYCTILDGITKLLLSINHKIVIKVIRENGQIPFFELASEEIVDYSGKIEFTNDNKINFTMDENRGGVNHLIGLGEGELEERMVVHKYVDENRNITNEQRFFGVDEVTLTYDYSSSDPETFENDVEEKLLELIEKPKMGMDVIDLEPVSKIGDIVGGIDYLTGLKNAKKIENIIYSVEYEKEAIDYELEGEK